MANGRFLLAKLGVVAAAMLTASPALALDGSPSSININQIVGAERFYFSDGQYTGTRAIQANIEGEHLWLDHDVFGGPSHVTTFHTGSGAIGSSGSHATTTAHMMGGRSDIGTYETATSTTQRRWGIGFDAELWSGAMGVSTQGDGSTFGVTDQSFYTTYHPMLVEGIGGRTVDVFNSSYGFEDEVAGSTRSRSLDGMINASGVVGVAAAGNGGSTGINSVGSPAAAYNTIAVGALSRGSEPYYNSVASFSSRSPQDFYHFGNDETIPAAESQRAVVDIVAPGTSLRAAILQDSDTPDTWAYNNSTAGTSVAAPIVAGGASLIVDAGKDVYANNDNAIDGRVVKSVLLNGADKIPGWSNGQTVTNGVTTTTQSLDYVSGAGRMNLDSTFDQYMLTDHGGEAGTADLTGLTGGDVASTGWDYGFVNDSASTDYFINEALEGGTTFTATLSWFVDRAAGSMSGGRFASLSGADEQHFANLDLEVFRFDAETQTVLDTIAESISLYNATEHLHFDLDEDGHYGIRVNYTDALWNVTGETGEFFGLAWEGTQLSTIAVVPLPAPVAMGAVMLITAMLPRRRRN
ncbi:MAG: S8 family serine peptidase [Phycisphaeraceae bacterium]